VTSIGYRRPAALTGSEVSPLPRDELVGDLVQVIADDLRLRADT
jgi:hypothetical protein